MNIFFSFWFKFTQSYEDITVKLESSYDKDLGNSRIFNLVRPYISPSNGTLEILEEDILVNNINYIDYSFSYSPNDDVDAGDTDNFSIILTTQNNTQIIQNYNVSIIANLSLTLNENNDNTMNLTKNSFGTKNLENLVNDPNKDSSSSNNRLSLELNDNEINYRIIEGPKFGTAEISSKKLIYTPDANFIGSDSTKINIANDYDEIDILIAITVTEPSANSNNSGGNFTIVSISRPKRESVDNEFLTNYTIPDEPDSDPSNFKYVQIRYTGDYDPQIPHININELQIWINNMNVTHLNNSVTDSRIHDGLIHSDPNISFLGWKTYYTFSRTIRYRRFWWFRRRRRHYRYIDPRPFYCTEVPRTNNNFIRVELKNNYSVEDIQSILIYNGWFTGQVKIGRYSYINSSLGYRRDSLTNCVLELLDENEQVIYTSSPIDSTNRVYRFDGSKINTAKIVNVPSTTNITNLAREGANSIKRYFLEQDNIPYLKIYKKNSETFKQFLIDDLPTMEGLFYIKDYFTELHTRRDDINFIFSRQKKTIKKRIENIDQLNDIFGKNYIDFCNGNHSYDDGSTLDDTNIGHIELFNMNNLYLNTSKDQCYDLDLINNEDETSKKPYLFNFKQTTLEDRKKIFFEDIKFLGINFYKKIYFFNNIYFPENSSSEFPITYTNRGAIDSVNVSYTIPKSEFPLMNNYDFIRVVGINFLLSNNELFKGFIVRYNDYFRKNVKSLEFISNYKIISRPHYPELAYQFFCFDDVADDIINFTEMKKSTGEIILPNKFIDEHDDNFTEKKNSSSLMPFVIQDISQFIFLKFDFSITSSFGSRFTFGSEYKQFIFTENNSLFNFDECSKGTNIRFSFNLKLKIYNSNLNKLTLKTHRIFGGNGGKGTLISNQAIHGGNGGSAIVITLNDNVIAVAGGGGGSCIKQFQNPIGNKSGGDAGNSSDNSINFNNKIIKYEEETKKFIFTDVSNSEESDGIIFLAENGQLSITENEIIGVGNDGESSNNGGGGGGAGIVPGNGGSSDSFSPSSGTGGASYIISNFKNSNFEISDIEYEIGPVLNNTNDNHERDIIDLQISEIEKLISLSEDGQEIIDNIPLSEYPVKVLDGFIKDFSIEDNEFLIDQKSHVLFDFLIPKPINPNLVWKNTKTFIGETNDEFGKLIIMNNEGNIISSSTSSGIVRIYKYNYNSEIWNLEQEISNGSVYFGRSIAFNETADIIAITDNLNVLIYRINENNLWDYSETISFQNELNKILLNNIGDLLIANHNNTTEFKQFKRDYMLVLEITVNDTTNQRLLYEITNSSGERLDAGIFAYSFPSNQTYSKTINLNETEYEKDSIFVRLYGQGGYPFYYTSYFSISKLKVTYDSVVTNFTTFNNQLYSNTRKSIINTVGGFGTKVIRKLIRRLIGWRFKYFYSTTYEHSPFSRSFQVSAGQPSWDNKYSLDLSNQLIISNDSKYIIGNDDQNNINIYKNKIDDIYTYHTKWNDNDTGDDMNKFFIDNLIEENHEYLNSIDISSNGNILVLANKNLNLSKPDYFSFYERSNDNWIKFSNPLTDIIDNSIDIPSISINDNGNLIAIGSSSHENNKGSLNIFLWDGNNWIQQGKTILGENENDKLGFMTVTNNVGDIIAVSSPNYINKGQIQIFELVETNYNYFYDILLDYDNDWVIYDEILADNNTPSNWSFDNQTYKIKQESNIFGEDSSSDKTDYWGSIFCNNKLSYRCLNSYIECTINNVNDGTFGLVIGFNFFTKEHYRISLNVEQNLIAIFRIHLLNGILTKTLLGNENLNIYHNSTNFSLKFEITVEGDLNGYINDIKQISCNDMNTNERLLFTGGFLGLFTADINNIEFYNIKYAADSEELNKKFVLNEPITDNNIRDFIDQWFELNPSSIPDKNSNNFISNWDVSSVTNMDQLFENRTTFNEPLNKWNVGNVMSMYRMFYNAHEFNQPLFNWDVSEVTNMRQMFGAVFDNTSSQTTPNKFNSNISNWDVSKVTNMREMFYRCLDFNQDISNWDVCKVTDMRRLFAYTSFNQDINTKDIFDNEYNYLYTAWDTSSVEYLGSAFANCPFNMDISKWNTSNVTNINYLFIENNYFNQNINTKDIFDNNGNYLYTAWDLLKVNKSGWIFHNAYAFNKDISNWNLSNSTLTKNMFFNAVAFNQDIRNWDLNNVTNFDNMFLGATEMNNNYNAPNTPDKYYFSKTVYSKLFYGFIPSAKEQWTTATNITTLNLSETFSQMIGFSDTIKFNITATTSSNQPNLDKLFIATQYENDGYFTNECGSGKIVDSISNNLTDSHPNYASFNPDYFYLRIRTGTYLEINKIIINQNSVSSSNAKSIKLIALINNNGIFEYKDFGTKTLNNETGYQNIYFNDEQNNIISNDFLILADESHDASSFKINNIFFEGTENNPIKVIYYEEKNDIYWNKLNNDFFTLSDNLWKGRAISRNGFTIVTSKIFDNEGGIIVYHYNGNIWEQKGSQITSNISPYFNEIKINSYGDIIAFSNLNSVYLYEWDSNDENWAQLGNTIILSDGVVSQSLSISLSEDGKTIAIGNMDYNIDNVNVGGIKVFKYDGTEWISKGNSENHSYILDQDSNKLGKVVNISGDGNVLTAVSEVGTVIQWLWEENSNIWQTRGNKIIGNSASFGVSKYIESESINSTYDGSIFIIGDYLSGSIGRVFIYEWNGTEFIERRINLYMNLNNENFGSAVHISPKGEYIQIGSSPENNSTYINSNDQVNKFFKTYFLEWDGTSYNLVSDNHYYFESDENEFNYSFSDNMNSIMITSNRYINIYKYNSDILNSFDFYTKRAELDGPHTFISFNKNNDLQVDSNEIRNPFFIDNDDPNRNYNIILTNEYFGLWQKYDGYYKQNRKEIYLYRYEFEPNNFHLILVKENKFISYVSSTNSNPIDDINSNLKWNIETDLNIKQIGDNILNDYTVEDITDIIKIINN